MDGSQPVLVFGDDGSAGADVAWLWVANHRWPGWRIEVIHVVPPPPGAPPPPQRADLHDTSPAVPRELFHSEADVVHRSAEADPRAVLGAMSQASLIVVGARGRGMFKALHLGSTADWLLQCPPAPLLIVRSAQPVRSVLVCIDGSSHAWSAVSAFAELPLVAQAQVHVLTVGGVGTPVPEDVERAVVLLAERGAQVSVIDRTPDPLEPFYSVRDIIFDAEVEVGADLLVLGTRGLSRWKSLGVGSIATTVARHSPTSVLMARSTDEEPEPQPEAPES